MSIRAYRLIEIKTADDPTFSVTHNYDFVTAYGENEQDGFIDFNREEMKRIVKDKRESKKNKEIAKLILKDFKKSGEEDNITYYCF